MTLSLLIINRKIVQHGRDSVSESLRDLFYHFREFMWQISKSEIC